MSFIEEIKERAKDNVKTIVLAEGTEPRVIRAARVAADEKFSKVILLGSKEEIQSAAPDVDLTGIEIFDYLKSDKLQTYANQLHELRQKKGVTPEKALEMVKTSPYFGVMMVYNGDADGMVSGAVHSTADTLRPALQILKTAPGVNIASSFFIMSLRDNSFGSNGTMLFSDCGLNENPNADELSEIAITSSKSFQELIGDEPKIAMLSFSTYGSAKNEMTEKVIEATHLVKEKAPELMVDGELQLDAAVIPEIAHIKAKGSPLEGKANILVFPDLNAGNIGYKLTQRFGGAMAFGPVMQGLKKPVNDLSRGSTVDDIVGTIAITAVQAQNI